MHSRNLLVRLKTAGIGCPINYTRIIELELNKIIYEDSHS